MKIPDCWAGQRTSKLNVWDSLQISLMNNLRENTAAILWTISVGHKLISEFVNIFMKHIFKITLVVLCSEFLTRFIPQSFAKSVRHEQSQPSSYYANFDLSVVVYVRGPI